MTLSKSRQAGFTLIELLVVIAIIAILSGIVLSAIQGGRSKANDTKLVAEVRQLQNALEIYYLDTGHYPSSGSCGATVPNPAWCNSIQSLSGDHWIKDSGTANVLSPYLAKEAYSANQGSTATFPPVGGGAVFYGSSGQWYMIVYGLSNPNKTLEATDGVTAPDGTYFHFGDDTNGVITVGRAK